MQESWSCLFSLKRYVVCKWGLMNIHKIDAKVNSTNDSIMIYMFEAGKQ